MQEVNDEVMMEQCCDDGDYAPQQDTAQQEDFAVADEDAAAKSDEEGEIQPDFSLENELSALTEEHPEIVGSAKNVNPERYSELRAMGLSMKEAYLATSERASAPDTRRHLSDSTPRGARSPALSMSRREMELARGIFENMSDEQIKKLYNKVKV